MRHHRATARRPFALLLAFVALSLLAAATSAAGSLPTLSLSGSASWVDRELALNAALPGSTGAATIAAPASLGGSFETTLRLRANRDGCLAGSCDAGALRLVIDRGMGAAPAVVTLHGDDPEAEQAPSLRWAGRDLAAKRDGGLPDLGDGADHLVEVRYAGERLSVTFDGRAALAAELAGAAAATPGPAAIRLEAANEGGQAVGFRVREWRWASAPAPARGAVEPQAAHAQGEVLVPKSFGIDYATQIHTLWRQHNPSVPTDLTCTNCHFNGAAGVAGLDLSGDASATYAQVTAGRVDVLHPEQSLILTRPAMGAPGMPASACFAAPSGPCYVLVLHWIQDGAHFTPTTSCTFQLDPGSAIFGAAGGQGTVSVQTAGGCTWNVSTHPSWVTIGSGASGNGNGTVHYTVQANADTGQRTGNVTIAGQTFHLTQAGAAPPSCTFQLQPTSASFPSTGGQGNFEVTTNNSTCGWSVTSGDGWIHAPGGTVNGNGGGSYTVDANNGAQRVGHLTIAGLSFAVTEAAGGGGGGGGPTLHPLAKCTLLDTRRPNGPFGGPSLSANVGRTINVNGRCGVPAGALGLRADVTVLGAKQKGSLALKANGARLPAVQKSFGKGTKKFAAQQVPVAANAFTARSTRGIGLLVEVTGYYK